MNLEFEIWNLFGIWDFEFQPVCRLWSVVSLPLKHPLESFCIDLEIREDGVCIGTAEMANQHF